MNDPLVRHEDVAGYLLGSLTPEERAAFERHLADCASCRHQLRELSAPADLLRRADPGFDLPPGLEAKVARTLERGRPENGASPSRSPRGPMWRRPLVLVAATAAAVATLFLIGTQLDRTGGVGQIELEAVLASPAGGSQRATAVVEKTDIGREISFRSDDLPILPKGEYYELWFVGPGDTLERPNRISAGTFHPDDQGRSVVELTAAVDPALFPILSVTAEPADGDPRRTGPEVLRSAP